MGLGLDLPPTRATPSPPEVSGVDGGLRPSPDPSLPPSPGPPSNDPVFRPGSEALGAAADLDLESFDDYDDAASVDGIPKLRLVDPPAPMPSVIVELVGERYEVSRLRENGTTVACVMYTRTELEELIRRAQAALEMG